MMLVRRRMIVSGAPAPPLLTQDLFVAETPAVPDFVDAGFSYSLGVKFQATQACQATHLGFTKPSTNPSSDVTLALFDAAGVQLGSTVTIPVASFVPGINFAPLPAHVPLLAGTDYWTVWHTPDQYCFTTNAFPVTNGILTASAGAFAFTVGPSTIAFPTNASTSNYFANVRVEY